MYHQAPIEATKYVYVELVFNKETKYEVVAGLFKGIVEKNSNTFILVNGLNGATNLLNLKFFNIMTIEELKSDYKEFKYFTQHEKELSVSELNKAYKNLLNMGMTEEKSEYIIDILKYKDVPPEYLECKPLDKNMVNSSTSTITNSSVSSSVSKYHNTNNNVVSGYTTAYSKPHEKKEPEPYLFSRTKGDRPTKSVLEAMEEKINQIMTGSYKAVIPDVSDDKNEAPVSNSSKLDHDDNDYAGYGFC